MEFEKVYYSLICYSKKRYAGLLWTKTDRYDYIDYKGIQIVRRDTPLLLKKLLEACMKEIFIAKNQDAVRTLICNAFDRLISGDYHAYEFSKSGVYSDKQYSGALPPAAEVALLLKSRGLPVPDRVEYVYIVGDPEERASKKVESPEYVVEHNILVDLPYYMTNQFKRPIIELLSPAVDGLEALIDSYTEQLKKATIHIEQEYRRQAIQHKLKVKPISWFFGGSQGS